MNTTLKLENEMSVDEIKKFLGKLKKDLEQIKKGERRSVYLNEILDMDSAYQNELEHARTFKEKFLAEKERAKTFLYDEKEAEKAGWNAKKEDKGKLLAWADKAYPNHDIDLWETEQDIENCISILKSL